MEYLTTKQAADYLGITIRTLQEWDRKDILKPSHRIGTNPDPFKRHRRYDKTQLDEFKNILSRLNKS